MSQPNEQYAYFAVTGSFDPEEITRRTGISPGDSWRTGDLHPRTRLERKFSRWSLHSRLPRSQPLEAHIKDVLARLDQNPGVFAYPPEKVYSSDQSARSGWTGIWSNSWMSADRSMVSGALRNS